MSTGWQIALSIMFIASGASGFERYMLQERHGAAWFDAGLMMAGAWWLAAAIDGIPF